MGRWRSLDDIRRANGALRDHWFDPADLAIWDTKLYYTIYGGRYFITSERPEETEPRCWSIRYATDRGKIETYGEYGDYASFEAAEDTIFTLLGEQERAS